VFTCSLWGLKGRKIFTGYEMSEFLPTFIDRAQIQLPDIMIETAQANVERLLRPAFDALWQAGGYPDSPNYDRQTGKWRRGVAT
jgi:hypothetical protein